MILEDIIRKRAHAAALESAIHAGNTTMTS
jgi:hypothetical protein